MCDRYIEHVDFPCWLNTLLLFVATFFLLHLCVREGGGILKGLFFSCHEGGGNQTQVLKVGGKHFYLLAPWLNTLIF